MTDVDANARVFSEHFIREDYIQRKQYSYLHDMVEDLIKLPPSGSQEDVFEIEIPVMIPRNIAPEVRPNKDKLIKEHCSVCSRFS